MPSVAHHRPGRRHLAAVGLVVVVAVVTAAASVVGIAVASPTDGSGTPMTDHRLGGQPPTELASGSLPRFAPPDPHDTRLRSGIALPLIAVMTLGAMVAPRGRGAAASRAHKTAPSPHIVVLPAGRAPPAYS